MTVSNVLLEPHRARLVTDTLGYVGKQPATFLRKPKIVPHAKLAFVVRGYKSLADLLSQCQNAWADIEAALADVAEAVPMAPLHLFALGCEITMLGWHDGQAKAARLVATTRNGRARVRRFDLAAGAHLAPSLGQHDIPATITDEQIVRIALLQQEIATKHGLNMCVGGDIEIVTVDVTGVSIRKMAEYPNKAMTAASIARADNIRIEKVAA